MRRLTKPFVSFAALGVLALACASKTEGAPSAVGADLLAPLGLLQRIKTLRLEVVALAPDISCDPKTGTVLGVRPETLRLAATDFTRGSCTDGISTFCGSLTIDSAPQERVISAIGKDDSGATFMSACSVATLTKPNETVKLRLVRTLAKPTCGNRTVEFQEECDDPADLQCKFCHAVESVLSIGNVSTGTLDSANKTKPAFFWTAGTGGLGRFVSVFEDASLGAGNAEISMRVLSDVLGSDVLPAPLGTASFFLPNDPAVMPPKGQPLDQRSPAATRVLDTTWIAYEESSATQGLDIRVRSLDSAFKAINATAVLFAGGPGDQTAPVIARGAEGAGGALLIVYRDAGSRLLARTLTPPNAIGPEQELGSTSGPASIAVTQSGWTVTWEDGGDIKFRIVGADGTPQGGALVVNDQSDGVQTAPTIAALPDGRFAIAFVDRAKPDDSNVMLQRFSATGRKVPGDQLAPAHVETAGNQSAPSLSAMNAASGSFVLGYLDEKPARVSARLFGGSSGYLLNQVDGTENEFTVSLSGATIKSAVTTAVGGKDSAIAFGWVEQDTSATASRIMLRKFPAPSR
jgi:hypothetical protein